MRTSVRRGSFHLPSRKRQRSRGRGAKIVGMCEKDDLPGRCTHGPSSYLDAANDHVGFVRKQGRKGEDQREGILGQPAGTRRRVFSTGALGGLLSTDSTSDYLRTVLALSMDPPSLENMNSIEKP